MNERYPPGTQVLLAHDLFSSVGSDRSPATVLMHLAGDDTVDLYRVRLASGDNTLALDTDLTPLRGAKT